MGATKISINDQTRVNYPKLILQFIETILKGMNTLKVAMGEIVNNSFDANASRVKIFIDTFEGKNALFIMDDGTGFLREKLVSIMSYLYSSHSQEDTSKTGKNGTGSKSALGLGDFEKTKVTYVTKSRDYPNGIQFYFDLDYLIKFVDGKKVNSDDYITSKIDENIFAKNGWYRDTGSTFILTGYDGRTVSLDQIRKILSETLIPPVASKVEIFDDSTNTFIAVSPVVPDGKYLSFSDKFKLLGNIKLDLYYGGSGEGPAICGPMNNICTFDDFFSELSKDYKNRVTRLWKSIGGYIYVENINTFRISNNSLNTKFYKEGACDELVECLQVIASELSKMNDEFKEEIELAKMQNVLEKISEVSAKISGTPEVLNKNGGGSMFAKPGLSDKAIFIVPKDIDLMPNDKIEVTLHNKGTTGLNFGDAVWSVKGSLVTLGGKGTGNKGRNVTINAGKNTGTCVIEIKGPSFGDHILKVRVGSYATTTTPYIAGAKYLNPGSESTYSLNRCDRVSDPKWNINSKHSGVSITETNGKEVVIKVEKNTPIHDFTLECFDDKNKIITTKRIGVVSGKGRKQLPMVTIGDKVFSVYFSTHYLNCIAVVEHDDKNDYPMIVLNPIHDIVKKQHYWMNKVGGLINGMAMAAAIFQVESGEVSQKKAMQVASEFIVSIQNGLFNKKSSKIN